ncbi:hypothetical protein [Pontibacter sp. H249]|uniref:hypothetical protein n=1 Tax=Pontibacter sp. H249 TaxID=3133420 RepID=UPI0030C3568C
MNDNGYGSDSYEMFPEKKPFKLTDFEIDDFNMLMFLPNAQSKQDWLNTCKRLRDLEKKGIEFDRLREAEEAEDDEE